MSQKIGDLKILIRTLQTILCVGSLPDFKNHCLQAVFSRAPGAVNSAVDGQCWVSFDTFL
jgi:hypothetical protein